MHLGLRLRRRSPAPGADRPPARRPPPPRRTPPYHNSITRSCSATTSTVAGIALRQRFADAEDRHQPRGLCRDELGATTASVSP